MSVENSFTDITDPTIIKLTARLDQLQELSIYLDCTVGDITNQLLKIDTESDEIINQIKNLEHKN
jgi:frataxin-like iron-binding protein CyaY